MKTRKIPMRTCVACQTKRPKRELVRIVRTPSQELVLDHKGKLSGRGAYVCPSKTCVDQAIKSKRLDRALGVVLTAEMADALHRDVEGAGLDGGMG